MSRLGTTTAALALAFVPLLAAEGPAAERGSELSGRAYLGRNRPVVGATVLVRPEADPGRVYLSSTDAKGIFRFKGLADGDHRVEVRRTGLAPVVKTGVAVRFPFRAVVEVPMAAAAADGAVPAAAARTDEGGVLTVSGRVGDRDGNPLPEVRLRLLARSGREDPRYVRSGRDGAFEIGVLPAGSWRLEVRGVGYLPIRAELDLALDARVAITLVRQPADYVPSPLELMPPERPIPPPGLPDAPAPL